MAPDGLVDSSLTLGKLDGIRCLSTLFGGPLPEQFSDVHRRVSIRVGGEPATAFEPASVPNASCTALRAYLRRVPWTDQANLNAFLPSYALNRLPKHRVGHPLHLPVRLSTELRALRPLEVFYGDSAAVLFGEDDYPMRFLVAPRLGEVVLISSEFSEDAPRPSRTRRGVSLKLGATDAKVALNPPHIAPKVQLPSSSPGVEDRHGSEGADPDIHADSHTTCRGFGDRECSLKRDPGQLRVEQFKLGECPAALEQLPESSPRAIFGDG